MRLRIVHQLSLLLLGAAVLGIAAVGGVVFWNLRAGFGDYLRARDEQQLDQLMQLVERRAAADPSMNWLRGSREAMQGLMDDFSRGDDAGPRPRAVGEAQRPVPDEMERPARDETRPPPPDDAPGPPGMGPPGRRRPPPPGPPPPMSAPVSGLGGRVQIFDAQGQWLAGREQAAGRNSLERAVKVAGSTVATIRLSLGPEPGGVDARFLRRQYQGLGLAASLSFALALMTAWWVARRWSRPLRELRGATQRVARGDLAVRVAQSGALEIAELIGDVNTMAGALQALEGARRVWIAQISHELRSPLAVLRGEFEAIEDGARQATPEVMASLRDEVLQLNRIVDDLHQLAMADLGRLPCEFIDGDASAALLRVARRFEARVAKAGLQFAIAPAPATAARWDFGRIEQLLGNLLENSLRYTDAPGKIRLSWQADARELRLVLEDSAPGVPAQQLEALFEPLYRGDSARRRAAHSGGSGLGLSIARAIARAHHGSMRAEASSLGGLALHLTLPLQPELLQGRPRR